MRILLLCQRVPFPPNRGDKIPNYHYIRHLVRNHDVVVACLADGAQDLENVRGLAPLVAAIDAVPVSRTKSRWRALGALVGGSRPLTVAYFDEPELRRRVNNRLANEKFDLALVCSSGMASYVETAHFPRIIQFTDLDSQKWQLYAADSHFPKSWVYQIESKRLLEYERHLARTFDFSLLCSIRDMVDFHRLIPGAPVRAIPNGVDRDYFCPRAEPKDRTNLVFTGVMDYRPNVDAAVWFAQQILPLIQARVADATFTICGASPAAAVRQLADLPGVTVTGAVADVRPHLARAAAAVVPIRLARGIQNKVLEAMAMGLPVVTTSTAHAGLGAEAGRELLVADEPNLFADAVVCLLQNESRRAAIGQAARAAIEARYRWESSLAQLDAVIAAVVNRSEVLPSALLATTPA